MRLQSLLLGLLLMAFNPAVFAGGESPLVIIKDFKFIPQEITIKRGQVLRWENREKRQYHSVWFEALGEEEPDYFFPDESFDAVFSIEAFEHIPDTEKAASECCRVLKKGGKIIIIDKNLPIAFDILPIPFNGVS